MARQPAPGEDALAALETRLGWRFVTRAHLVEALRHSSASDGKPGPPDNERLEFLGDRVLGLVVAEHLFARRPPLSESELAQGLNALVNRGACARAARRVDLGAALTLSKSEAQGGGRNKETILGDACEALIAALYLDGGMAPARGFIERFWAEEFAALDAARRDAKSRLQEWAAANKRALRYDIVERSGADHAPNFIIEAIVDGFAPARGEGGSKREAEQNAAAILLKEIVDE